jgi:glycosyltransferase involved in cell wall biosynthesis
MIKGRIIVCVASSWDYDPTGKHHIMRILSRHNDILWINYHGSRRPKLNRADLTGAGRALRRVTRGLRRVSSSIAQLTPLVIPGATHPWLRRLHERMLISQIGRAIREVAGDRRPPVQVWSFAPDVPYLVGAFDEECFLYYCVDEFAQFEGFDPDRIRAAENELVRRATVVVTSSEPLLASRRAIRPDTVLVRHGVDFDHFASAWRSSLAQPADLAAIPRPIFGFFGLIHHWVDRTLIAEVARLRPFYSFVLIGDVKVDVSELARLDNVFLLGRRPYDMLPAYCSCFDGGLLPFCCTAMTRNVNPVKINEYLAAGLPVVSTPLPEVQHSAGPVVTADTAQRFAEACDRLSASCDQHDREAISRCVEHDTWSARVEQLSAIIEARNGSPIATVSKPRAVIGFSEPQPAAFADLGAV